MASTTLRKISEDDLMRIMSVETDAQDLEILAHRLCSRPYATQEDIAQLVATSLSVRRISIIMKRFLAGHMDVQVAVEKGKGFTPVKND